MGLCAGEKQMGNTVQQLEERAGNEELIPHHAPTPHVILNRVLHVCGFPVDRCPLRDCL